jgi:hypothetical protein
MLVHQCHKYLGPYLAVILLVALVHCRFHWCKWTFLRCCFYFWLLNNLWLWLHFQSQLLLQLLPQSIKHFLEHFILVLILSVLLNLFKFESGLQTRLLFDVILDCQFRGMVTFTLYFLADFHNRVKYLFVEEWPGLVVLVDWLPN